MKNKNPMLAVDARNYQAIEWLEALGNAAPTDSQITLMETLLRVLGLLLRSPVTLSEFKHLAHPETLKLLTAIERHGSSHVANEQEKNN